MESWFFLTYIWTKETREREGLVTKYLLYMPVPLLVALAVLFYI